ncbi:YfdY family protein [Shimwellia blattae]|uniref:Putative inner membrane protein n=2 Tax=Shimwellia blattae TaxID=563 RepID=I2B9K2_SHIBC|nr:YfdY family protein [Shimwellia blattae]AFJ47206.1 putative inner membrane protein [Shimwellia blattae DSM 4481 = NBRC 105725]
MMIYLLFAVLIAILSVSYYTGSVSGYKAGIASLLVMLILAGGINHFTLWLTQGNALVSGIFSLLSPAIGAIFMLMMSNGKRS